MAGGELAQRVKLKSENPAVGAAGLPEPVFVITDNQSSPHVTRVSSDVERRRWLWRGWAGLVHEEALLDRT